MNHSMLFILFSLLILQCSCINNDDDLPSTPCFHNCDTSNLEVVWQVPLQKDTGEYGSFDPLVYNGDVLFSLIFETNYETLKMRDGKTGELKWEWDEQLGQGYSASDLSKYLVGNQLIYNNGRSFYSINLDEGSTNWAYKVENGCNNNAITLLGSDLYGIFQPCGQAVGANYVVRTNIDDGLHWDTVFVQSMEDGYTPGLWPPSYWVGPNNDTLLLVLDRKVQYHISSDTSNKVNLVVFNMTGDSLEYVLEEFDETGLANHHPPLVWQDVMYVQGRNSVFCFDIPSGQLIWRKTYPVNEGTATSNLLVVNNKLIVNTDIDGIYALDPFTGIVIWERHDSGSNCADMVEHDGIVYFGCVGDGYLYAVDTETGKHIWKERSPNRKKGFPDANFLAGVAINPGLGYLYVEDKYFAMCIKLPEK